MKKILFLLCIVMSLSLVACTNETVDKNKDTETKYFEAKVIDIDDNTYTVEPLQDYDEYSSSNRFVIPQIDSSLEFPIIKNDIIGIFYTGNIKETYPATIDVSSIIFVGTEKEHPQVVMINGQLYYNTGKTNNIPRCGVMDGEISESVDENVMPTKDNQSNFGTGYGYQLGEKNTIDVLINDNWYIFNIFEEEELFEHNGIWYKSSELSSDTINWLKLSKTDRILSSYFPPEFVEE